jgi:hypothetical protein
MLCVCGCVHSVYDCVYGVFGLCVCVTVCACVHVSVVTLSVSVTVSDCV